jgi:hypothetical protein
VTQATIGTTICRAGWASAVRQRLLPAATSASLKRQVERAYGVSQGADVEGDHLIPIEVGGLSGGSGIEQNFWPEPNDHPQPHTLNSKDEVENAAHAAVCSGRMPLADAQRGMASDWVKLGQQLGVL